MSTYQERKAARKAAYMANQGKTQPRRTFRVYATSVAEMVDGLAEHKLIASFPSRKEAEEFTREFGPGTAYGSAAMKTVRNRFNVSLSDEAYVRFSVVSEAIES